MQQPAATQAPAAAASTATEAPATTAITGTSAAGASTAEIKPVKIGVLIPLTGALSEFGVPFQNAAKLAQQDLATAGYKVDLVFGDSETSAIPAVERVLASWSKSKACRHWSVLPLAA